MKYGEGGRSVCYEMLQQLDNDMIGREGTLVDLHRYLGVCFTRRWRGYFFDDTSDVETGRDLMKELTVGG